MKWNLQLTVVFTFMFAVVYNASHYCPGFINGAANTTDE